MANGATLVSKVLKRGVSLCPCLRSPGFDLSFCINKPGGELGPIYRKLPQRIH
jgi:hypothetical protein